MKKPRIFYFVPTRKASNGQWHLVHVLPALKDLASAVNYFDPLALNISDKVEINDKLVKLTKSFAPDLFLSLTTDEFLFPETVVAIKTLGAATVNFTCDNLDRWYDIQRIAPVLDYCWVTEPEAVATIKTMGGRPIHLPMAANPRVFRPQKVKEIYQASFCGSKNGSRPWYIYHLLNNSNIRLMIGGSGWQEFASSPFHRATADLSLTKDYVLKNIFSRAGWTNLLGDVLNILNEPGLSPIGEARYSQALLPSMDFKAYIRLYSESKLSLGFNEKGNSFHLPRPIFHLRLRDFEAPMSGACYVAHRSPELMSYFEEEKEMLYYSSLDELMDLITFYGDSKRINQRNSIRKMARKRALSEHTWQHRLVKLLSAL